MKINQKIRKNNMKGQDSRNPAFFRKEKKWQSLVYIFPKISTQ